MVISEGPNSSLELVILIIIVKNTTFIAQTAVWHNSDVSKLIQRPHEQFAQRKAGPC